MKPGDLVRISWDVVPETIIGVLIKTVEYTSAVHNKKRKFHLMYTEGCPTNYWEEDWKFEVISEAR
tara:strand:+ start:321 stop:518 length:198 start_codon:yes stop_codon:yes gene_type:complete